MTAEGQDSRSSEMVLNRVFFRMAYLGRQVNSGAEQSSLTQRFPAPGVRKPCAARSSRQGGRGSPFSLFEGHLLARIISIVSNK